MALFTDDLSESPRRERRGGRAGWTVLSIALAGGIILGLMPSPYVIEKPGPVFDTLGSVAGESESGEAEDLPLITIPGQTVYPTEGRLDLLTVSVVGNRENRPSWLAIAAAWVNPNEAVLPLDQVYPAEVSTEQREAFNETAMVNSQRDAVAAALTHLGYDYPTTVSVVSLADESPATGLIEVGDRVVGVNGAAVTDITDLREALKANGTTRDAAIEVVRDGQSVTVDVTPIDLAGTPVVGINVSTEYEFPFEVEIQLDRVGGPSAGLMFALGIIDKLTPGSIQNGEHVAGTGTINRAGTVGPIGGIQQKLSAADDAGADWFLAPMDNCNEVTGNIPDGLTVFAVATLDDALAALEAVRTGAATDSLPACPAG
ncbi:MAG: S16 family serine protease [Cryobacterium sp.]